MAARCQLRRVTAVAARDVEQPGVGANSESSLQEAGFGSGHFGGDGAAPEIQRHVTKEIKMPIRLHGFSFFHKTHLSCRDGSRKRISGRRCSSKASLRIADVPRCYCCLCCSRSTEGSSMRGDGFGSLGSFAVSGTKISGSGRMASNGAKSGAEVKRSERSAAVAS